MNRTNIFDDLFHRIGFSINSPISIFMIFWRIFLLFAILYLKNSSIIKIDDSFFHTWLITYIIFIFLLLLFRLLFPNIYTKSIFNFIRIHIFNILLIWIIIHEPINKYYLSVFFFLPIVESLLHFDGQKRIWFSLSITILEYILGFLIFAPGNITLDFLLVFTISLTSVNLILSRLIQVINDNIGIEQNLLVNFHKFHDYYIFENETAKYINNFFKLENFLFVTFYKLNSNKIVYFSHNYYCYGGKNEINQKDISYFCTRLEYLVNSEQQNHNKIIRKIVGLKNVFKNRVSRKLVEIKPICGAKEEVIGFFVFFLNSKHEEINLLSLPKVLKIIGISLEDIFTHRDLEIEIAKQINPKIKMDFYKYSLEDISRNFFEIVNKIPLPSNLVSVLQASGSSILLNSYYSNEESYLNINDDLKTTRIFTKNEKNLIENLVQKLQDNFCSIRINYPNDSLFMPNEMRIDNKFSYLIVVFKILGIKHVLFIKSLEKEYYSFVQEKELIKHASEFSEYINQWDRYETWRTRGSKLKIIYQEFQRQDLDDSIEMILGAIIAKTPRLLDFNKAILRMKNEEDNKYYPLYKMGIKDQQFNKIKDKGISEEELALFLKKDFLFDRVFIIPNDVIELRDIIKEKFIVGKKKKKDNDWDLYNGVLIPLNFQSGERFGLLSLDSPKSNYFPSIEQIESIGVFCDGLENIIELFRSRNKIIEHQERILNFIVDLSSRLADYQDNKALGDLAVNLVANLLNAEGASLFLIQGKNLVLMNSTFLNEPYIGRSSPLILNEKCGLSVRVALKKKLINYSSKDLENDPYWAGEKGHLDYLKSGKCISLISAPVFGCDENDVIGVLSVENKSLGKEKVIQFDKDDEKKIRDISRRIGRSLKRIEEDAGLKPSEISDDIHEIINYLHSGVVLPVDQAIELRKKGNLIKSNECMAKAAINSHTITEELFDIHRLIRFEYLSKKIYDSLISMQNNWVDLLAQNENDVINFKKRIKIECSEGLIIPDNIKIIIIKIVLLALSNSIRHSGFGDGDLKVLINIKVIKNQNHLTFLVKDNGKGFNTSKKSDGYGFVRMNQLISEAKGYLNVENANLIRTSKINGGTEVFGEIYLKYEKERVEE